jgi:hypothetical protein
VLPCSQGENSDSPAKSPRPTAILWLISNIWLFMIRPVLREAYREANRGSEGASRERRAPLSATEIHLLGGDAESAFPPDRRRAPAEPSASMSIRYAAILSSKWPTAPRTRGDAAVASLAGHRPKRALLVKTLRRLILTLVGFFMVRPAFLSAIERRTALRSMWWCDPATRS